ncbi:MAG TPA: DPP IV N-terminal domain-containing protein, partial [Anaerolineales bacterium]|nr:DPP IV N-terminal domain-containing protein [Anaerolineales bacterium]
MGISPQISTQSQSTSDQQGRPGRGIQLTSRGLGVLLAANLAIISLLARAFVNVGEAPPPSATPAASIRQIGAAATTTGAAQTVGAAVELSPQSASDTPLPTDTGIPPTLTPTVDLPPTLSSDPQFVNTPLSRGTMILALREEGYSHLFAYQPMNTPFTRLTEGPWDDITPAVSPENSHIAFASNRDGQWDLYLLAVSSGEITRLTDTPEYDAAPSWSPDGRFLVFETYIQGNLEISIQAIDGGEALINLSEHPAADFSPSWSPQGRQIAFVSTRSGESEIWLADLDKTGQDRFQDLSQSPTTSESHPVWSPDGGVLAWAAAEDGYHNLYTWKAGTDPSYAGSGDWPAWNPAGDILLTALQAPNQTSLAAHNIADGVLALPPQVLPGSVWGITWADMTMPVPLPRPLEQAASSTPAPLWLPEISPPVDIPGNRQHLVPLQDVEAPYPQLHDLVDESFQALRERVASDAGWDVLATLENAFVPLTSPLAPGLGQDWLYTGRAFAINPLPVNAGWIVIVPEKFGPETYWRVYLKARFQNGSQGTPLHNLPWDFDARYQSHQESYELGGARFENLPIGYWADFTELARAFGWERLPALPTWQSSFPAA